jgi:hypothetical protein
MPVVCLAATLAVLLFTSFLPAQDAFQGPPQAARGYELFFNTAKPVPCGSCHAMSGKGVPAAPDLKNWARIAPRATAMAITATVTANVVSVEPKGAEAFPGIKASEDAATAKFYDLSANPPALKELPKDTPIKPNAKWKHPPGQEKYTPEELADLVGYIRWAGAKDKKEITPEEVQ